MGGLIAMELNVKPDLRVFPDVNELSLRAAEAMARTITTWLERGLAPRRAVG